MVFEALQNKERERNSLVSKSFTFYYSILCFPFVISRLHSLLLLLCGNWRKDILNDPLNKVTVPGHKGPHPEAMHQEIYKRLSEASELGSEVFKQTLEELSKEATEVGSWLNKILTKT